MSIAAPTGPTPRRRIGLVTTYPPTICGLATFGAALGDALVRAGNTVDIVRVRTPSDPATVRPVACELVNGDRSSMRAAIATLSSCDAVIVAHEYGIYGGTDGDEVLTLLDGLAAPTIVIAHTVPSHPTEHQDEILRSVGRMADRVVVMARTARDQLVLQYGFDPATTSIIPHGARVPDRFVDARRSGDGRRPVELLTWGLLGPGKGVEHMIDAMALLGDDLASVHYTVAGVTHPKVLARHGDRYRASLMERARSLGLGDHVTFDDSYRDVPTLTEFVASATAVVLPYDSVDQVTSGVLVDAIAAGTPVIATGFPHALELLSTGAGQIVEHRSPAALAAAVRRLARDRTHVAAMTDEARRLAPSLGWDAVACRYATLADATPTRSSAAAVSA